MSRRRTPVKAQRTDPNPPDGSAVDVNAWRTMLRCLHEPQRMESDPTASMFDLTLAESPQHRGQALCDLLMAAIDRLDPGSEVSQKSVIYLRYAVLQSRYIRSYTAEETAEAIGISTATVYNYDEKAIKALAEYLRPYWADDVKLALADEPAPDTGLSNDPADKLSGESDADVPAAAELEVQVPARAERAFANDESSPTTEPALEHVTDAAQQQVIPEEQTPDLSTAQVPEATSSPGTDPPGGQGSNDLAVDRLLATLATLRRTLRFPRPPVARRHMGSVVMLVLAASIASFLGGPRFVSNAQQFPCRTARSADAAPLDTLPVRITWPTPGATVRFVDTVEGAVSKLPPDWTIWVLITDQYASMYHPQVERADLVGDKHWRRSGVRFGGTEEGGMGQCYRISIALANPAGTQTLEQYFAQATLTDQYTGFHSLPPGVYLQEHAIEVRR